MPITLRKAMPVLVAAAFAANAAHAQEIDLSYRWQAGDKFTYALANESSQNQSALGQEQTTSSNSEQVVVVEVVSVDDEGNSTIRHKTESIKISVTNSAGMEMSYDSEAESNASATSNPMVAALASLDGSEFTVVVAPDGSVIDLPDYDAWKQDVPEDATPEQKRLHAAAPEKAAVMQNIEGTYKALAGRTIAQGEGWTTEMRNDFAAGAYLMFTFQNTVVEIADRSGDRQADIETAGEIELNMPSSAQMQFNITEQEIEGKSVFSSEKGALVSSEGAMNMTMSGGPPGAGAMMTMTMNQKSVMRLVSFERGG